METLEINYECKRCKKIVRAKVYKTNFKNGKSDKDHNRVDCAECGKYIKFIGERELTELCPGWQHDITSKRTKIEKRSDSSALDKRLDQIEFKLDVIIDFFESYK